jgi:hypothetical protein
MDDAVPRKGEEKEEDGEGMAGLALGDGTGENKEVE